jgi:hypothetical protein
MLSWKSCSKEIRPIQVRLLYSMVLINAAAPSNSQKNVLSGKSCSWRKSWAKAYTGRRYFSKVLYENDLKIKNKPSPERFNLRICIMKLSSGILNLVRLSL